VLGPDPSAIDEVDARAQPATGGSRCRAGFCVTTWQESEEKDEENDTSW